MTDGKVLKYKKVIKKGNDTYWGINDGKEEMIPVNKVKRTKVFDPVPVVVIVGLGIGTYIYIINSLSGLESCCSIF